MSGKAPAGTLTLAVDECWVIRATGGSSPVYFMAHRTWNQSAAGATIFREMEAAEQEIARARGLGFIEPWMVLDAVPLAGALRAEADA